MNLLKTNLFKNSIFKQARFLVSTPQRAQTVVCVSETGVISKDLAPMYTGYMTLKELKMTWIVLHSLKITVRDKDGGALPEQVLLISERNYLPLDPFGRLSKKDRENLTPLSSVARIMHAEKRAHISEDNGDDARTRMMSTTITACFIIMGLLVLTTKIWG